MIRKTTIKEAVYKKVKTGEKDVDIWITSDGEEHRSEHSANEHEFYEIEIKRRFMPDMARDAQIITLNSLEQFERFEQDNVDYDDEIEYKQSEFTFPNTYVFYKAHVNQGEDEYPEFEAHCVTLEKYKKLLFEYLAN